jgi:hypothetical protein
MMMTVIKLLDMRRLALISMFMVLLATLQLTDFDYFWHLKAGEYIVTHGALPEGDVFSFTHLGQPWVLHEWLFEVVLYGMFTWLGPLGVKLLTVTLAMTALGITYALMRRLAASPLIALILLLAAFIPFKLGISPRPQLVTYVFFVSFLYVLLSYKYFQATRYLLALPLLMVVWVNAHGGYMLGLALAGLFMACEWANYWVLSERNEKQKLQLVRLTFAVVATALASAINPGFLGHWLYPFQVMGLEATRQISEWQSPDFHDWGTRGYLMLALAFFVSYTYMVRKPDFTELFIPTLLLFASFIAIRHIPLAALTLISFIALALSRGPAAGLSALWHRTGLALVYERWIGGGKQLGNGEYVLNWVFLLVIVFSLAVFYPIYHAKDEGKANAELPVKAAEFVANAGIAGHMFNSYGFGGYLIYRLYPAQKVFIDGRADMYGDAFFKEYAKIIGVKSGWEKTFDKYQIDYVITGRDEPLRQILQARGDFRLVYEDEHNSVLVRNAPRYADIIAKYGL